MRAKEGGFKPLASTEAGGSKRAFAGTESGEPKRVSAGVETDRAKRAFAVLTVLFAALGLMSLLSLDRLSEGENVPSGPALAQAHNMVGAALSGSLPQTEEVPAWFADEIFSLEGAQSYASNDVGVYGFVSERDSKALKAHVQSQMQERGWVLSGSGDSAYLGFSRPGGSPSSAMVGFTEQELGTTVVVQVMR